MSRARALNVRLFQSMLATQELIAGYLGVRLGLYAALAGAPATPEELAGRAGIAPRYAREWLEQQAVAGFLDACPDGRFHLPDDHAEVLLASGSPLSMASLTMLPVGGVAAALPALLDAYRTGKGVPDDVYGDDWRAGHGGANRALFTHHLPRWIRETAPDLHARLRAGPARVADVGCGAGWAGIALSRTYPWATVHGVDPDAETRSLAARNASEAGVPERVTFRAALEEEPYDLVCLFDTLHELPAPAEVLAGCRTALDPDGVMLVLDARVAPEFTAPGDEIERFQYATSVLHCLPAAEATGTGTVLRPAQVSELAAEAGFAGMTELPIDDRFHRLYRLEVA